MFKKFALFVLVALLLPTAAFGSGVRGYMELAAGTTDSTVVFIAPVGSFEIEPVSADISVDVLFSYGGEVNDIDVEVGEVLAPTGVDVRSITIDRTGSTAVKLWWGMNNQ